jgi:EAL and modified HD-GYP domain-containing signal transduction protein
MAHSVLDSISLGYQLVWNPLRQLHAVALSVGDEAPSVDATALLTSLNENWPEQAPALLLSVQAPDLLVGLLEQASPRHVCIAVDEQQLRDPALAQRVHQAHQRGVPLIWRGEPGLRPSAALAPCFVRQIVTLTPEEALTGMRASLRKHHGTPADRPLRLMSPVKPNQIYDAVASRVLAEHCLDDQGAWGVCGWPMEDLLHGYRHQRIQPNQHSIVALIDAIDADDSVDAIEQTLSDEPLLAYRYLRYTNSAALGLRTEVESLRQGLMVLGYSLLRAWLLEQLPHASSDLNLQPVRTAMVMRARLMAQLMNTGDGDDLRREIYLCGLLSQIDLMLGEPLQAALARFPASDRVTSAILSHSGPYAPYLDMAITLESPPTPDTVLTCNAHQMHREAVNRALLRTLAHTRAHRAKGLLLV